MGFGSWIKSTYHSIGKKVGAAVSTAASVGKKALGQVASVAKKVGSVAGDVAKGAGIVAAGAGAMGLEPVAAAAGAVGAAAGAVKGGAALAGDVAGMGSRAIGTAQRRVGAAGRVANMAASGNIVGAATAGTALARQAARDVSNIKGATRSTIERAKQIGK